VLRLFEHERQVQLLLLSQAAPKNNLAAHLRKRCESGDKPFDLCKPFGFKGIQTSFAFSIAFPFPPLHHCLFFVSFFYPACTQYYGMTRFSRGPMFLFSSQIAVVLFLGYLPILIAIIPWSGYPSVLTLLFALFELYVANVRVPS